MSTSAQEALSEQVIQSRLEEIICLLFPIGRGSESSRHVNKAVWENTREDEEVGGEGVA